VLDDVLVGVNRKFGVGLFMTSYFQIGTDNGQNVLNLVEQAQTAESLGFKSLFLGHHYLSASNFLQPISTLAYLAAHTKRILLGLGVFLLPLHNPLALAEELATVHVLSKGRLIAGFGCGYREREFQAFGIPYAQRFSRLEECASLLERLWNGEAVSDVGSYGTLSNATVHLASGWEPPEIWLGAFGEVGIKRSARLGLSWLAGPDGTVDILAERVKLFCDTAVKSTGAIPKELPLVREVYVGETDEEAIEFARPYLEKQYSDYKSWDHGLTIEKILQGTAVVGSPDTVLRRFREYQNIGFTQVVVRSEWPGMSLESSSRSIELLGREVLPHL
jgi:alkanesulfonate monooxygenase SsuD/methylene tetrahydromethanopterin reductase-like flavin-dependent oxidoreductase (luciferase family)